MKNAMFREKNTVEKYDCCNAPVEFLSVCVGRVTLCVECCNLAGLASDPRLAAESQRERKDRKGVTK